MSPDAAAPLSAAPTASPALPQGISTVRMSSGDQAALYIRWLIFDGKLRPGARVPQDDIARTLGVSRIPVREALIALEREGWLTIEPHRGAFINALDEDAVRDHYELYGLVYGFAVRRALARTDAGELAASLDPIVKELRRAKRPEDCTRLALGFQRTVVTAARSHRVKVVIRAMSGLVPGDFFSLVPDAIAIERRGLPVIARAIAEGDGDTAASEYVRMMQGVGEKVVAVFKARGLFEMPPADASETRTRGKRPATRAASA